MINSIERDMKKMTEDDINSEDKKADSFITKVTPNLTLDLFLYLHYGYIP